MGNAIAGSGHYSHRVPTTEGVVVLIRDGNHAGTEVYALPDGGGFRFVSLDSKTVSSAVRCALVRLSVSVDDLAAPFGCDLDTPDGLALVGLDPEEDASALGEVIWDSAGEVPS